MGKFKVLSASFAFAAAFGASACMAQQHANPSPAAAPPTPHATQVKRCQDIGRLAQNTAAAREASESEQHVIGRLGLNMHAPNGLGLIHQRLAANVKVPGNAQLVHSIYSSDGSAAAWQKKTLEACAQSIS